MVNFYIYFLIVGEKCVWFLIITSPLTVSQNKGRSLPRWKIMVNVLPIPTEINRTTKLTQQYFWLSSKNVVNLNLSHFYSSGCITWRGRSWVVWWTIQRRIPSKKSRLLWWRWRRKLLKLTYWEITAIDPDSKGLLMSKQCIRISFSR